jgi:hypothetical protein
VAKTEHRIAHSLTTRKLYHKLCITFKRIRLANRMVSVSQRQRLGVG